MAEYELRDHRDIVKAYGLDGFELLQTNADTVVALSHSFATSIWSKNRLWQFTDHGLPHSHRLLSKVLELSSFLEASPNCELSPYEKLIVVMAGLLHDIGLQYENFVDNSRDGRGILAPQQIRDLHCKLGLEMIEDTATEDSRNSRKGPLPPLLQDQGHRETLLDHASKIAFAHQGGELWTALKGEPFDDRQFGNSFRPRLLAALLRLGDELDCDVRRVPDIYELQSSRLPTESQMHWATCYYIHDVQVDTKRGILTLLRWRVPRPRGQPDPSSGKQATLIEELITTVRKNHIDSEFEQCHGYLLGAVANGGPPAYRVELLPPSQVNLLESVPSDVERLLVSRRVTTQVMVDNLRRLSAKDEDRTDAYRLVHPDLYRLHVVLESGTHTNTFLRCRALVTDSRFCRRLVDLLVEHYRSEGINSLCAVGTSALTLATVLAQRLGAELTFTFGGPARKERYDEFEWKAHIEPGSTVLIVDDILAQGDIALDNIRYARDFNPVAIHYFAIFSLGKDKSALQQSPDVPFTYLYDMEDVEYWPRDEDDLCKACRGQPGIRVWEYRSDEDLKPDVSPVYCEYPSDVAQYYRNRSDNHR